MTSNKFPFDVAIAGALGAVIALTLALTIGWSPYLWPIIGLIVGPLCYRPWEVAITCATLGQDLWNAAQRGIDLNPLLSKIGLVLAGTGKVLGCILLLCVSGLLFPVLVGIIINWLIPTHDMWAPISILTLLGTVIGICNATCLTDFSRIPTRWAMPIFRLWVCPLLQLKGYKNAPQTLGWEKKHPCITCIFLLPFLQLCIVLIIPLIIDILVTIALACASTKRIASMIGATLGCTVAAITALSGISWAPAILVVGGTVGWCGGSLLFLLREYLATSPKTILVTS